MFVVGWYPARRTARMNCWYRARRKPTSNGRIQMNKRSFLLTGALAVTCLLAAWAQPAAAYIDILTSTLGNLGDDPKEKVGGDKKPDGQKPEPDDKKPS